MGRAFRIASPSRTGGDTYVEERDAALLGAGWLNGPCLDFGLAAVAGESSRAGAEVLVLDAAQYAFLVGPYVDDEDLADLAQDEKLAKMQKKEAAQAGELAVLQMEIEALKKDKEEHSQDMVNLVNENVKLKEENAQLKVAMNTKYPPAKEPKDKDPQVPPDEDFDSMDRTWERILEDLLQGASCNGGQELVPEGLTGLLTLPDSRFEYKGK